MSTTETLAVQKTPEVCGGSACIRQSRIPVWMLVLDRKLGMSDGDVLNALPSLTPADLDAAWEYYRDNPVEIERAIWFNDTAANVADGVSPPAWIIVAGRLLGIGDDDIQSAFDPPLTASDLDAAWAAYRTDPQQVGREATAHRLAG